MVNEKCTLDSSRKQIQNLKDLLAKFVTLSNEINVLHDHVSTSRNVINVESDGSNVNRNKSIDDMDPGYMQNSSTAECSNQIDLLRDLDTGSNFGVRDMLQNTSESFPNGFNVIPNRAIDHLDPGYIGDFNAHVSTSRNVIIVKSDGSNISRNQSIDDMDLGYMQNSSTPECSNGIDLLCDLDTGSNYGAQGDRDVLQNLSESFRSGLKVIPIRAIDHLDPGYTGNFNARESANDFHSNEMDVLRGLENGSNENFAVKGDVLQNASESFPNCFNLIRNRAIDHLDSGNIENFNAREKANECHSNGFDVLRDLDTGSNEKICERGDAMEMENLKFIPTRENTLMGIDLPKQSNFNENHLQLILNKTSKPSKLTTNYLYYLFDDSDVLHDTSEFSLKGQNEIDAVLNYESGSGSTVNFSSQENVIQYANESFPNGFNLIRNRAIDHLDSGYIGDCNAHVSTSRNVINVESDGPNVIRNKSIDDMDPGYMQNSSTSECSNGIDLLRDLYAGSNFGVRDVLQNTSESFPNGFHVIPNRAIDHLHPGYIENFNACESANEWHSNEVDVLLDLDSNENFGAMGDDPSHEEAELVIVDVETLTEPTENEDIAICNIGIRAHRGCDDTNMTVPTSDQKGKKYCCIYCLKRYPNLERHLRTVHKTETDVQKFLAFRPRTKQRRTLIAKIRNRGQFKWNSDKVLNGGELSTIRRPNRKFQKKPGGFLSCAKCFGTFTSTGLTRHFNKCTNNAMKGEKVAKELGRATENRIHSEASGDLCGIFSQIRVNSSSEYVRQIRFDWLVVAYGNDLCLNYSPEYQHGYIRGKLRACAKVLMAAKSISPEVSDFSSLYHVRQCNTVVDAIRRVAKFDFRSKLFGAPGTASTLVTLINTVGELLLIERMKRDEPEKERDIERFLTVFKKEAKTKINKLVAITQAKNKRRKKANIPTLADVNKLVSFLNFERDACFIELTQEYSYKKWIKLSQLTLASVLVFNRRRTGEMRNISVDDYSEREMIADLCDPLLDVLPKEIKKQIKSRMQIRGKLNRTVPVLLKYNFEDCIEILIRHRKDACIPDTNEFLFALPTKTGKAKTIDACTVMRSFADVCGANNPLSLRGTNLRKHLASYCGTKNLKDNHVTNVAKFMGHDDKIHRDIYRQNPLALEVVQMTFLLNAAQGTDVTSSSEDEEDENEENENEENELEELIPTTSGKPKSIKSRKPNKVLKLSTTERRENVKSSIATAKKVVGKVTKRKRINNRTSGTKNRETKNRETKNRETKNQETKNRKTEKTKITKKK